MEPEQTTTGRLDWLDRLVELHVLADNGDRDAAAEASRWIEHDGEARRVWDTVARTCADLRLPRAGT